MNVLPCEIIVEIYKLLSLLEYNDIQTCGIINKCMYQVFVNKLLQIFLFCTIKDVIFKDLPTQVIKLGALYRSRYQLVILII